MTDIHELPNGLDVAAGPEHRRGLWLRLVQHGDGWRLAVTVLEGSARRSLETTVPGDGFSLAQAFTVVDGVAQWDEGTQAALLAPIPVVLGSTFGGVERSLGEINRGWDRLERERGERR